MSIFDAALTWLSRGVALVPLQPRSKRIVAGFGPYLEQVTTEGQAAFWFRDRGCNLALVTGRGLVVYDFDKVHQWERWRAMCPDLARTYTELTRDGAHVFFAGDGLTVKMFCGIESKGRGGVVMSAPSVHPSGFVYHPLDKMSPILPMPAPAALSLLSESLEARSRERRMASAYPVLGDVVGRIKAAYDVLDLAQGVAHLVTKNGTWWHGNCPLDEHKRSDKPFWVNSESGLWGCYACGVHGDVINLYARLRGMGIKQAIKDMATNL